MSERLETLLNAARQLPPEEQRLLAEKLLEAVSESETTQKSDTEGSSRGKVRQHFGEWDSGTERSADNQEIDRDLAGEFAGTRGGEA